MNNLYIDSSSLHNADIFVLLSILRHEYSKERKYPGCEGKKNRYDTATQPVSIYRFFFSSFVALYQCVLRQLGFLSR